MKNRIDWKQFGQFLKLVIDLFKLITGTFKEMKIGPEILEWVTGSGQKTLVEYVSLVGKAYQATLLKEPALKADPIRMEADLDADPILPFAEAVFQGKKGTKHLRQGKVVLEYRPDEDELYVNGRKLVLFVSELQKGGKTARGYTFQAEAEANNPTNATLADVLYEHQEFIPKKSRDRVWFFWGTVFSDSDGGLSVRYLRWYGERWYRRYSWLGSGWGEHDPSASLASESSKLAPQPS